MSRKRFFAALAMAFMVILLSCCAITSRTDFDDDCDCAKARYEEMQKSLRTYHGLGTTSVAEIAVVERHLKKAKAVYKPA